MMEIHVFTINTILVLQSNILILIISTHKHKNNHSSRYIMNTLLYFLFHHWFKDCVVHAAFYLDPRFLLPSLYRFFLAFCWAFSPRADTCNAWWICSWDTRAALPTLVESHKLTGVYLPGASLAMLECIHEKHGPALWSPLWTHSNPHHLLPSSLHHRQRLVFQ